MKTTFIFLADGFEEMEAIAVMDVLRRGGMEVRFVSVASRREVKSAHGVTVLADLMLDQVKEEQIACMIFPGGMPGAQHLAASKPLIEMLQRHFDKEGWVAAICAAPALVLSQLKGRKLRLTCYPGFEKYVNNAEVVAEEVVVDENVITGKGPGFALPFGIKVLEKLASAAVAQEVAEGMLL